MKRDRDLAADVLGVVEDLIEILIDPNATRRDREPCDIPHLGYEIHVERPRRAGIDPAYQALMNQALAESETHHQRAS